jgi:plasmid replication initiation protein
MNYESENTKELLEAYDIEKNMPKELAYQIVSIRNSLARKQTVWTIRQNKIFLCALAEIGKADSTGMVTIPKFKLLKALGLTGKESGLVKNDCKALAKTSYIEMDDPTEENFISGNLISTAKGDRNNYYIRFMPEYIPYLAQFEKNFTRFYLGNVLGFKTKYGLVLYQYLKSWYYMPDQKNELTHKKYVALEELKHLFGIGPKDYVRKSGKQKGEFVLTNFKAKVLTPAWQDINGNIDSDLNILGITQIEEYGKIIGFRFEFCLVDNSGYITDFEHAKKYPEAVELRKLEEAAHKANEYTIEEQEEVA